jgi:predicted  nucleic acid-binding Zn-ribbon protein
MNSARLARKWREAGGDFNRMAEDLSDELTESLATKNDLAALRAELKAEMEGLRAELRTEMESLRSDFRALRADFSTLRAEMKADMAAAEAKLARTLILTQVSGFVALAVLILLK